MVEPSSPKLKKLEYTEKLKVYKQKIDEITETIKTIEKEVLKNNELSNYGRLSIANNYLNIIAMYCTMSDISMSLLRIKNEGFLNEGRKILYKVFSVLEEIVGKEIDAPFSEYADRLATIAKLDDRKRLNLYKKLLDALKAIMDRFGPNSKWKWSFVDLDAECAMVMKNMTDFRKIQAQRDPRIEGFIERNEILRMVKEYLKAAANRYREKYEMVTHEPGEMKKAILFLSALQRLHTLFNEPTEAESTKKNIAIWQDKLDKDLEADEEKKKYKQPVQK
jgi:hypothetical protein